MLASVAFAFSGCLDRTALAFRPRLPRPVACPTCWHPALHAKWQWQLTGRLNLAVKASMYDVDMFDTRPAQVRRLHRLGRRVVCYIDAGSWENWRPDAHRFPHFVIGRPLAGWPGERWLDIRRVSVLAPLMKQRVLKCRRKGFDGVEFDNVDGYQNPTGFHLSSKDQLRYNVFLANLAHRQHLSVALKNDPDQALRLIRYFDWSLDEQCFQFSECHKLLPFLRHHKPVFEVEYSLPRSKFCPAAHRLRFNAIRKRLALGPWIRRCRC